MIDWGLIAYHAYGNRVAWKNFRGDPIPEWKDLGDEIRAGWDAAAHAVVDRLMLDQASSRGEGNA